MSVDYSSVGGIGVKVTCEMITAFIARAIFPEDEWNEYPCDCMDEVGIPYHTAGNSYSGDIYYYFMVEGKTLEEINTNAPKLVEQLKKYGIDIELNELQVVSDLYIW